MAAGQRVETFTQKSFLFFDRDDRLIGIRVVNQLAETLPRWLRETRVRLMGLSPLFVAEPVTASPSRVAGLSPHMLDPDTGKRGAVPAGYGAGCAVEEHNMVVTAYGDVVPSDERPPQQRIAMFTQLDYAFMDRETGQTLASRSHGRVAQAIEAWAEANRVTIRGMGQIYIRNPPKEVPYGALDQSRLVNPRTRNREPYIVDNPERVTVLEYMTIQPVFGCEEEGNGRVEPGAGAAGAPGPAVSAPAPAGDGRGDPPGGGA